MYKRQIQGSEFLRDGTRRGQVNGQGIRHEDVTALTLPTASLDLICSFDVIEHVPDYRRGLREFSRCLAPGGLLLLSTPFFLDQPRTKVRAVLRMDGSITHLHAPEYHGDPLSADGALCFYHFGWSLLDDLRQARFVDVAVGLYWSRRHGHMGGLQHVLLARKA